MRTSELYKYNPSQASTQELEATFVGRDCLVEEILTKLEEQAQAKSNQNYLIIGPRGIGKTNTMLILQNRIKSNATLSKTYLPLSFAEEEYSVITLRDFFVKILDVLRQPSPNSDIETTFESISSETDDDVAVEKAIDFLRTFSKKNNYKLLIFIDNFDLIFNDQIRTKSSIKRFRDVLMNENFLLIIGAAPTYFEEVMGYDKPLYNFFKMYALDDFDVDMMEAMLRKRAQYDGNDKLIQRLESFRPKLQAIRHLTGGNPRLVLMLYQLLVFAELPEVKTALNALLDDLTPYYKHKLESIKSPQQRKIVDTLARMDRAATPTELSKATRLHVNQVSSLIKRLQNEGYVRPAQQERRKATYYILSERLFRIWHQMRYAPAGKRRMPFLVDFISLWYSLKEMEDEYTRLEKHFKNLYTKGKTKEALSTIDHIGYLAEAAPSVALKAKMFYSTIYHYMDLKDWDSAEAELQSELQRFLNSGNMDQIAKCHFCIGIVYASKAEEKRDESLYQQAFEKYQKAVEIKPDEYIVWYYWSNDLCSLAELKKDENLYRMACEKHQKVVEIRPDFHGSWYNWGISLGKRATLKNDESLYLQAIEKFRKALKINPEFHNAWCCWGICLAGIAKIKGDHTLYQQVFDKYQKAIEIKPDLHEAWYNWGNGLISLANHKEDENLYLQAFEKFQKAVEIKPDLHEAWDRMGAIYAYQTNFDLATENIEKAYELALKDNVSEIIEQYSKNMVITLFESILKHIDQKNKEQAKDVFTRAYEWKNKTDLKFWIGELIEFLGRFMYKKDTHSFFEFYDILKDTSPEDAEMLEPLTIVLEYLQKGEDAEVLDRLNPELREVVEEIIKKISDAKENS